MSASTFRAFQSAIAKRQFERAYFFFGDDEYRKEEAVRELLVAAVEALTRDFNLDVVRGNDATAEVLGSLLQTPPLMAAHRVVVVRDVSALRKDVCDVLDAYLRQPSPDTILLLIASAGTKSDRRMAQEVFAIEFALLSPNDQLNWIAEHARAVQGVTISPGAAQRLRDAVSGNTARLAAELDKLASYTRGAEIDEAAVAAVVSDHAGRALGELLDAVAERDTERALSLVEAILVQPKAGLVPSVIAMAVQTLALGWARAACDRGLPAQRLESEFFTLLKETGAYPMRPWGEATKCWARNHARWDVRAIDQALDLLLAADRAAKETKLSSEEQSLSTVVVSLCAVGRRTAA